MEYQYRLNSTGSISIDLENGSVMTLPKENNGTPEWRTYQEWLDAGNTPLPYVPPTPVDHITDLQEAKDFTHNLIKSTAYQHLQPTDWYIVRFTETGVEIPQNITTFRETIRQESSSKIAVVDSKETLEDLKDYLRSSEYSTWTPAP